MTRTSKEGYDIELVEELMDQFCRQCNYVKNKQLLKNLKPNAIKAAEVCNNLNVDPATYVAAQVMMSPLLRGYKSLTPQQLCSKDSIIYVIEYLSSKGEARNIKKEFEVQCEMLGNCILSGWKENVCLFNPSFDFAPWFRVLLTEKEDSEILREYGYRAAEVLNNDRPLMEYLRTVKTSSGQGLDFGRLRDYL